MNIRGQTVNFCVIQTTPTSKAAAMLALPKRNRRRILLLIVAVPLFCFAWYAVVRIASPWNAVRVRANPAAASKTDSEFPHQLRIGAFNIAHGRGSGDDNWNGESRRQREQRLRDIASFLKDANLDIVVLNEVDFDSSWSHRVNQAEFIAKKKPVIAIGPSSATWIWQSPFSACGSATPSSAATQSPPQV